MKIFIADLFSPEGIEQMRAAGHEVVYITGKKDEELATLLRQNAPEIIIVRSTKVEEKHIDACPTLRLIIRAGSGYDTIKIEYAAKKGVRVCNCPGKNSVAVAELVMAHMLNVDRCVADNVADLRGGRWEKGKYSECNGIFGRTLGIVGMGAIGKEVAIRARAFGLRLLGFDPFVRADDVKALEVTMVDNLQTLLQQADIITMHVPNTPDTKGMCGRQFFEAMKDGAVFINTSRGAIVKDDDLLWALENKHIWAALDVYNGEPAGKSAEFATAITRHAHVYGTHHIGASTKQAEEAIGVEAVNIVSTLTKTGTYLHVVNGL